MLSNKQKIEKENRIKVIMDGIRKNPDLDRNELYEEIAGSLGFCLKTAKEYVRIALWRLENEKSEI